MLPGAGAALSGVPSPSKRFACSGTGMPQPLEQSCRSKQREVVLAKFAGGFLGQILCQAFQK